MIPKHHLENIDGMKNDYYDKSYKIKKKHQTNNNTTDNYSLQLTESISDTSLDKLEDSLFGNDSDSYLSISLIDSLQNVLRSQDEKELREYLDGLISSDDEILDVSSSLIESDIVDYKVVEREETKNDERDDADDDGRQRRLRLSGTPRVTFEPTAAVASLNCIDLNSIETTNVSDSTTTLKSGMDSSVAFYDGLRTRREKRIRFKDDALRMRLPDLSERTTVRNNTVNNKKKIGYLGKLMSEADFDSDSLSIEYNKRRPKEKTGDDEGQGTILTDLSTSTAGTNNNSKIKPFVSDADVDSDSLNIEYKQRRPKEKTIDDEALGTILTNLSTSTVGTNNISKTKPFQLSSSNESSDDDIDSQIPIFQSNLNELDELLNKLVRSTYILGGVEYKDNVMGDYNNNDPENDSLQDVSNSKINENPTESTKNSSTMLSTGAITSEKSSKVAANTNDDDNDKTSILSLPNAPEGIEDSEEVVALTSILSSQFADRETRMMALRALISIYSKKWSNAADNDDNKNGVKKEGDDDSEDASNDTNTAIADINDFKKQFIESDNSTKEEKEEDLNDLFADDVENVKEQTTVETTDDVDLKKDDGMEQHTVNEEKKTIEKFEDKNQQNNQQQNESLADAVSSSNTEDDVDIQDLTETVKRHVQMIMERKLQRNKKLPKGGEDTSSSTDFDSSPGEKQQMSTKVNKISVDRKTLKGRRTRTTTTVKYSVGQVEKTVTKESVDDEEKQLDNISVEGEEKTTGSPCSLIPNTVNACSPRPKTTNNNNIKETSDEDDQGKNNTTFLFGSDFLKYKLNKDRQEQPNTVENIDSLKEDTESSYVGVDVDSIFDGMSLTAEELAYIERESNKNSGSGPLTTIDADKSDYNESSIGSSYSCWTTGLFRTCTADPSSPAARNKKRNNKSSTPTQAPHLTTQSTSQLPQPPNTMEGINRSWEKINNDCDNESKEQSSQPFFFCSNPFSCYTPYNSNNNAKDTASVYSDQSTIPYAVATIESKQRIKNSSKGGRHRRHESRESNCWNIKAIAYDSEVNDSSVCQSSVGTTTAHHPPVPSVLDGGKFNKSFDHQTDSSIDTDAFRIPMTVRDATVRSSTNNNANNSVGDGSGWVPPAVRLANNNNNLIDVETEEEVPIVSFPISDEDWERRYRRTQRQKLRDAFSDDDEEEEEEESVGDTSPEGKETTHHQLAPLSGQMRLDVEAVTVGTEGDEQNIYEENDGDEEEDDDEDEEEEEEEEDDDDYDNDEINNIIPYFAIVEESQASTAHVSSRYNPNSDDETTSAKQQQPPLSIKDESLQKRDMDILHQKNFFNLTRSSRMKNGSSSSANHQVQQLRASSVVAMMPTKAVVGLKSRLGKSLKGVKMSFRGGGKKQKTDGRGG